MPLLQQEGAKKKERKKPVLQALMNAPSAPTLPPCDEANTSALLPGLWPTNPFTPCKHKQIDTLHREPDNPPSFHPHSRLSSITGILSLVSSLVARRANRSLEPPPPPPPPPSPTVVFINVYNKASTSDRQVQTGSGGRHTGGLLNTKRPNG